MSKKCGTCHGMGSIVDGPKGSPRACPACGGSGVKR